jgi:hypothetical protein
LMPAVRRRAVNELTSAGIKVRDPHPDTRGPERVDSWTRTRGRSRLFSWDDPPGTPASRWDFVACLQPESQQLWAAHAVASVMSSTPRTLTMPALDKALLKAHRTVGVDSWVDLLGLRVDQLVPLTGARNFAKTAGAWTFDDTVGDLAAQVVATGDIPTLGASGTIRHWRERDARVIGLTHSGIQKRFDYIPLLEQVLVELEQGGATVELCERFAGGLAQSRALIGGRHWSRLQQRTDTTLLLNRLMWDPRVKVSHDMIIAILYLLMVFDGHRPHDLRHGGSNGTNDMLAKSIWQPFAKQAAEDGVSLRLRSGDDLLHIEIKCKASQFDKKEGNTDVLVVWEDDRATRPTVHIPFPSVVFDLHQYLRRPEIARRYNTLLDAVERSAGALPDPW